MVNFCPECSGLLRKKIEENKAFLACRCGYKEEISPEAQKKENEKNIKKKKKEFEKKLIVVSKKDKITPNLKVIRICPKCSYKEAETWQEQTRSADEPSTTFFRCLKCRYTWREY